MGRRTKNHASSYPIMCMYLKFSHQFDFMLVSAFYVEVFFFIFHTAVSTFSSKFIPVFHIHGLYIFPYSTYISFSFSVLFLCRHFNARNIYVQYFRRLKYRSHCTQAQKPNQLKSKTVKGRKGGSVCEGRYQPNIYCIS